MHRTRWCRSCPAQTQGAAPQQCPPVQRVCVCVCECVRVGVSRWGGRVGTCAWVGRMGFFPWYATSLSILPMVRTYLSILPMVRYISFHSHKDNIPPPPLTRTHTLTIVLRASVSIAYVPGRCGTLRSVTCAMIAALGIAECACASVGVWACACVCVCAHECSGSAPRLGW